MELWVVLVIVLVTLAFLFALCACWLYANEDKRTSNYKHIPEPLPSLPRSVKLRVEEKPQEDAPVLNLPLTFPRSTATLSTAGLHGVDETGYYLRQPDMPLKDHYGHVASLRERFPMQYETRPDLVKDFSETPTGRQMDLPYNPDGRHAQPELRMYPDGVKGGPTPYVLPATQNWKPRLKDVPKLDSKASALISDEDVTGVLMRGNPVVTRDLLNITRGRGEIKGTIGPLAPGPYSFANNPENPYIPRTILGTLPTDIDEDALPWQRPKSGWNLGRNEHEFSVPTAEWQREKEEEKKALEEERQRRKQQQLLAQYGEGEGEEEEGFEE